MKKKKKKESIFEKYKGLIILIAIVAVLTAVISWICFSHFSNKKPRLVNSLEIYLQNNNKIDKDTEKNKSNFEIVNRSDVKVKYKVVISDNSNDENGINRKYLKYELDSKGKKITSGKLTNIKNNILLVGTVKAKSSEKYSLKIDTDTDENLEGKTYEYNLSVVPIMK